MGDRAQVKVIENEDAPPVYLYTHWDGYRLKETVAEALALEQRWDDASYLTRIIFGHMTQSEPPLGTTGFGISTLGADDAAFTIRVDVGAQTVSIDGDKPFSFREYVKHYA